MRITISVLIRLLNLKDVCKQANDYKDFDVDHEIFKDGQLPNPCGMMARFYPQDIFQKLAVKDGNDEDNSFRIEETPELADRYFAANFKKDPVNPQWVDVENPRFINWMVF